MDEETPLDVELHGYVDGFLDEESMARIERYLRTHPDVASRVQAYRLQKHELRAFAQVTADHNPLQRIAALEQRLSRRLMRRLRRPWFFGWPSVAAIATFLTLGWGGHVAYLALLGGPPYADEAVQAHVLSTTAPEELMAISPERLARLFRHIGELQRMPDLRELDLVPVGAQLLPSDAGLLLHMPYRDSKGTIVSYFVVHTKDEREEAPHVLHRNGLTLVHWQHAHSQYALAAPLDDNTMRRIALLADRTQPGT